MSDLVIVASAQFGYHIDTYYYCKYLRGKYKLTYIGWDHELSPVRMGGVNIINVSRHGGLLRIIRMLRAIRKETTNKQTIMFIKYIKLFSIAIRLTRLNNPMILDVRTGSIADSKLRRRIEDGLLKCEAKAFKNITVISEGLAKKLSLSKKSTIIPLGSDVISESNKSFDSMRLLYVGTLHKRNIETLVDGVMLYISKHLEEKADLSLTIIGDGFSGEIEALQSKVERNRLKGVVKIVGRVPHNRLERYFNEHNVGVSYIPLTDYYDVQPPTKTFEYLMSGMPVLATNTSENARVINSTNGVLIGESAEDVCEGIEEIERRLKSYSSDEIRKQSRVYSWPWIVERLGAYLENI